MPRAFWTLSALAAWLLMGGTAELRPPGAANEPVITWLRTNARPLASVEPGSDFADLAFLEQTLKGVQVVGLGEATHGTREFFQAKHRLLQFLVTRMGFTVLAMEASTVDIEPLNDYLLHGKGDLSETLTAQGYLLWDTEEVASMMEWIRAHNQSVPAQHQVHVVGLDMLMNTRGRGRVLDYVRAQAPTRLAETEALFQTLAEEQARIGPKYRRDRVAGSLVQLQALQEFLVAEQTRRPAGRDSDRLPLLVRDVQRMVQLALTSQPAGAPGRVGRSESMGRNLTEVLQAMPNAKIALWAHNTHIGVGGPDGGNNLGSEMRATLGNRYYGVGFEFGRGTVQVRPLTEHSMGPLQVMDIAPPADGSLPWCLAQASDRSLFVDLRGPRTPMIERWLADPIVTHFIWWNHQPDQVTTVTEAVGRYDGLLFVHTSSRSRPTKNALERAAKGIAG